MKFLTTILVSLETALKHERSPFTVSSYLVQFQSYNGLK